MLREKEELEKDEEEDGNDATLPSPNKKKNMWALVDFGNAIGVVPLHNVKPKKNKDGSVDKITYKVLWSDGKAYDAVIIVEGNYFLALFVLSILVFCF